MLNITARCSSLYKHSNSLKRNRGTIYNAHTPVHASCKFNKRAARKSKRESVGTTFFLRPGKNALSAEQDWIFKL